ncbi:S-adenosyl-L-methionine-dependent methyltransferase [Aaosphaeria arxii CBS 175.79]|uniref:S-adenosyl-L-methionine-dependent methyltransferase n=1 Tax=Aaosphaeria arxii CBS 175.79 TaxID=1450172 RepID=A0A6A5XQX5_9PLEO|nr:S-adenosyl-L-methionine-dependent methyltransferase [Aaosphaeria arxii CBS 175.79]KAF2015333.1 S-adenosyl-L-methionine-dependent methyltransferase [Aaosphaeria arxii CBS 175.79]
MPRLPYSLLWKARAVDHLLPPLVKQCRDVHAAQNELRWLRAHADTLSRPNSKAHDGLLRKMVEQRSTGMPLQYILGTEFFGDLEIKCRPGVLIPRQETAASVTYLAQLLQRAKNLPSQLHVMDLCTGTGCIPLLFQHELHAARRDIQVYCLGVDISTKALDLAKSNLRKLQKTEPAIVPNLMKFMRADILKEPDNDVPSVLPSLKAALELNRKPKQWDILISNPPYISPSAYWKTTTRSVRGFEPKLALVPKAELGGTDTEQGDAFYPRLLATAVEIDAKVVLFEVADLDQAVRVAHLARKTNAFDGIEIWRDQPDQDDLEQVPENISKDRSCFPIIGAGNGRSVLLYRGVGASWLGMPAPMQGTLEQQQVSL